MSLSDTSFDSSSVEDMDITFLIDRTPDIIDENNSIDQPIVEVGEVMNNNLNLFRVLFGELLDKIYSYLTINDMSYLDISVCNKYDRFIYLRSDLPDSIISSGSDKSYGDDYIAFLSSRKITVQTFIGDRIKLTDKIFEQIIKTKSFFPLNSELISLNLSNCAKLKNSINFILESCKKLNTLDLSNCRIDNIMVTKIVGMSNIVELNLAGCLKINDNSLIPIIANNTSTQKMDISYCKKLTNKFFVSISKLSNLETLAISGNRELNDGTLLLIAKNCLYIRDLKIDRCPYLSISVKQTIGTILLKLEVLQISHEFQLVQQSDEIFNFVNDFKKLRYLYVRCSAMNNMGYLKYTTVYQRYPLLTCIDLEL